METHDSSRGPRWYRVVGLAVGGAGALLFGLALVFYLCALFNVQPLNEGQAPLLGLICAVAFAFALIGFPLTCVSYRQIV